MFDTIIIGAGPAGTAAAYDLLEKGLSVLILDRRAFPRKKACAGGITPKGFHLFRYDISRFVQRECHAVRIIPPKAPPFLITGPGPLCYMTQRSDLDCFSLNKVIEKGADFRVIEKIVSIFEKDSRVEVRTESDLFRAGHLIGADGANSRVRQFVPGNLKIHKQVAVEADVQVDDPDQYHMEFDFSRSQKGYFWIFPRKDHLNIGIYSTDLKQKPEPEELYAYAKTRLSSSRLTALKGYPIGTGGFTGRPGSQRILLCGDAAGFGETLLGEGIYFALKSGQKAALAIQEAETLSLPAADIYAGKIKSIQTELKIHEFASRCLYRFPALCLKGLSFPLVHQKFANGYAQGKTIQQILFPKQMLKNHLESQKTSKM